MPASRKITIQGEQARTQMLLTTRTTLIFEQSVSLEVY